MFALKAGEVTDVIRTKQGYTILQVTEHQMAGIPPLKEVEPRIQDAFYMQKLQPALRAYLTTLREEAFIDYKTRLYRHGRECKANQAGRNDGQRRQREEAEKEKEAGRVLGMGGAVLTKRHGSFAEAHERVFYLRLFPAGKQGHHLQLRGGIEAGQGEEKWRALPGAGPRPIAAARSKPRCGTTSRISSTPSSRTTFSRSRGSSTNTRTVFSSRFTSCGAWKKSEIDFTDYLPKTTKDIGELWRR